SFWPGWLSGIRDKRAAHSSDEQKNQGRKRSRGCPIHPRFWDEWGCFLGGEKLRIEKRIRGFEKLKYMYRNPVKRGLVTSPEPWRYSSFRWYAYGEKGLLEVNAPMKCFSTPTQRKPR